MKYIIEPYISVNNFLFGKSQSDVKKKNGVPYVAKKDNIQGIVTEDREGCELVYEEKKLAYVSMNKHVHPMVAGIEIYAAGAIEALKKLDPDHMVGPKYMIFRGLGICIGGLSSKKIPEGRIATAFAKHKVGFFEFFVTDY